MKKVKQADAARVAELEAAPQGEIVGDRYAATNMKAINR